MASIGQYASNVVGPIEDVDISGIRPSTVCLRLATIGIKDLALSIKSIGLLQPLVVRTKKESFEIVAGNRRYLACKGLGWRKISCHIVELDDKTAYEVSMIENLQRHTLSPLEEGIAFRKYVQELGWGGVTELASKIAKSPTYVSKRMNLMKLPSDILELISQSEIKVTVAEELLSVRDKGKQSRLGRIIHAKKMSLRQSRKFIREQRLVSEVDRADLSFDSSSRSYLEDSERSITGLFDKSIIALRIALKKLGTIISMYEDLEQSWIYYDTLIYHRNLLNSQIDLLIRQRKRSKKLLMWHH
jgi:ParB family transcriptional regulator, chromosome partitioning protein